MNYEHSDICLQVQALITISNEVYFLPLNFWWERAISITKLKFCTKAKYLSLSQKGKENLRKKDSQIIITILVFQGYISEI